MRIPIYESKLIKTIRFEPEEIDKIEQIHRILNEKAAEARQDSPSEASVIRTLVRLGIEEFHRSNQKNNPNTEKNMRNMQNDRTFRTDPTASPR